MRGVLGFIFMFPFFVFVSCVAAVINAFSYKLLSFKSDVLWQFCDFVLSEELFSSVVSFV
jgi:hypothetical protein